MHAGRAGQVNGSELDAAPHPARGAPSAAGARMRPWRPTARVRPGGDRPAAGSACVAARPADPPGASRSPARRDARPGRAGRACAGRRLRRPGSRHVVVAPGRRRRAGLVRPAHRRRDRHRVREVAGLPAADLSAISASIERPGARGDTVLYLSPTKALAHDQLAAMSGLDIGGRSGHHVRRRLLARGARLDPQPRQLRADQSRHGASHDAAQPCSAGRRSGDRCGSSWSTSATTTAGSSAPTSRRSCAGSAGSPPTTARSRPSSWPRRPPPSPM